MLSCPDTVRNASRPKKSCTKSTWPCAVRGRLARSSVDTRNSSPAPSASDPVMIGVLTQKKLFSSKNRWIACARVCRTLVAAAITFVLGRRCAQPLARSLLHWLLRGQLPPHRALVAAELLPSLIEPRPRQAAPPP